MQDNDERLGTRYPIKPAVMGFPADKVTCRMQTFESISLRPLRYVCLFSFIAPPRTALGKCEISMQDNDEKLGTRHPIKPAVMGFPADKVTCWMQTFESISLRPFRYVCLFGFTACYMGNMVCALLHLTHSHIAHYSIPNLSSLSIRTAAASASGVGSKGESSWWRRMKTWRVFSVMDRPLCLGTV